ncbi:MAG: hypothetical protein U0U09_17570 [Cyclobacteriaceae bacterium]
MTPELVEKKYLGRFAVELSSDDSWAAAKNDINAKNKTGTNFFMPPRTFLKQGANLIMPGNPEKKILSTVD